MGVHIQSGFIHLACVSLQDGSGFPQRIVGASDRLKFSDNYEGADQLVDLKDRVRQDLRDWNVDAVGLLETSKYSQWTYAHATTRILAISAVMYACVEERSSYDLLKPTSVRKHFSLKDLSQLDSTDVGFESSPAYWTTGLADAYATATLHSQLLAN
ncbi:hypothetical protein C3B60_06050 [Cryobacterium zongtaii]|nr:hypothetical protein C3B60_06050 [Cryobacterium zongtaii]